MVAASSAERTTTEPASTERALRVLHLIIVLGETNSQYNQHCLPLLDVQDVCACTYFPPKVAYPPELEVFAGDGTLRGFFRALEEALASREYDAVHVHAPQLGTLAALAVAFRPRRWGIRRKLVYTVRDSYHDYKPRNKLLMVPPLATYRRVVFCGSAAYDSYPRGWKRLVGKRMRVISNAADLDRVEAATAGVTRTPRNSVFTVLSIGRLEKVKDPLTLVSAFAKIEGERSRLLFIGAGSLDGALSRAIATSALGSRVELTGLIPRDEVFVRCARADLFVSASRGEGLPVAVIEAMATGCPVILSDIPPHREVADGVDFVPFVGLGDADGFAREIERFRTMTPEERTAIGEKCRELARERFALEPMLAAYEALYRELG